MDNKFLVMTGDNISLITDNEVVTTVPQSEIIEYLARRHALVSAPMKMTPSVNDIHEGIREVARTEGVIAGIKHARSVLNLGLIEARDLVFRLTGRDLYGRVQVVGHDAYGNKVFA
jgi:hypothetical protein